MTNSHRHASESWHPAFVPAHADRKRNPSFRWGDGKVGAQIFFLFQLIARLC
jgi:hypothetical protein